MPVAYYCYYYDYDCNYYYYYYYDYYCDYYCYYYYYYRYIVSSTCTARWRCSASPLAFGLGFGLVAPLTHAPQPRMF